MMNYCPDGVGTNDGVNDGQMKTKRKVQTIFGRPSRRSIKTPDLPTKYSPSFYCKGALAQAQFN